MTMTTTTISRADECIDAILGEEGGVANNPADHGGLTGRGISAGIMAAAIRLGYLPAGTTAYTITPEQAAVVYRELFWKPFRCDLIPAPADLVHFDGAVQHRPKVVWRILQVALGVNADGMFGDQTRYALRTHASVGHQLALQMIDARRRFYLDIVAENATQKTFLKGWLNRMNHLQRLVEESK